MLWGGKFLKAWSKTMEVLALSSGESELGALVKACTEGLGVQSLLSDYGIPVSIKILGDSTAAIGMVRRLGLGRVRHLAVADLWVQQRVRDGSFSVAKHPGATNGADLMTKHKSRDDLTRLLAIIGFGSAMGRASTAPKRVEGWNVAQAVDIPRNANGGDLPTIDHLHVQGVDSEPNLHQFAKGESRPYLMLSWLDLK